MWWCNLHVIDTPASHGFAFLVLYYVDRRNIRVDIMIGMIDEPFCNIRYFAGIWNGCYKVLLLQHKFVTSCGKVNRDEGLTIRLYGYGIGIWSVGKRGSFRKPFTRTIEAIEQIVRILQPSDYNSATTVIAGSMALRLIQEYFRPLWIRPYPQRRYQRFVWVFRV